MQQLPITIGSKTIMLRPTLAAALVLTANGDIQKLFRGLVDLRLGALVDVIHSSQHPANSFSKAQIADLLLADGIVKLSELSITLMTFIASLIENEEEDDGEDGETLPLNHYLEKLFGVGTGFIGWSPEATWASTPNEIMKAAQIRADFWSSLFGGKPDQKSIYDETRDEGGLEELRLLGNARR